MKAIDKHYLTLQFNEKIYKYDFGTYQSFFEDVMGKAYPDFQKIRPYGNRGDGGNDGFREKLGIYYQLYAPLKPEEKEAEAAEKFEKDFNTLKEKWDHIAEIKEFHFVYNEKFRGSVILLNEVKSKLEIENPEIKFHLFLAEQLLDEFFNLDEESMISLGFNLDLRQSVSILSSQLRYAEEELDKENIAYASKLINICADVMKNIDHEHLELECGILECKCFQKQGLKEEAIAKYKKLSKLFPKDPRAFLYLAEFYLNEGDIKKNETYFQRAKEIDDSHWLFKLEELFRRYRLGEDIIIGGINESSFPEDKKHKAHYYRFFAQILEERGQRNQADCYIEKAIKLNPNMFHSYIVKFSFLEQRLVSKKEFLASIEDFKELIGEVEEAEKYFSLNGGMTAKKSVLLNRYKINSLRILKRSTELEKVFQETLELCLSCSFDEQIDEVISLVLMSATIPDEKFEEIIKYLDRTDEMISEFLSKGFVIQFGLRRELFSKGKSFFERQRKPRFTQLVSDIESDNIEAVYESIRQDLFFSVSVSGLPEASFQMRKQIIYNLPDLPANSKDRLLLELYSDHEKLHEAFQIIKKSNINDPDAPTDLMLEITYKVKAWEYVVQILEKILPSERKARRIFNLKLKLFTAYFYLEKFSDAMGIGKEILYEDFEKKILDAANKEILLSQTIFSILELAKVDDGYAKDALKILEKYNEAVNSFNFKLWIEARVYLANCNPGKAFESVIQGILSKGHVKPKEYADLFFFIQIQILGQLQLSMDSLEKVTDKSFVKLKDKETWYFIGTGHELDANKIDQKSDLFEVFLGKANGEEVVFGDKYGSKTRIEKIELIYSIEQYICWKVNTNFKILSEENLLESVVKIEVPEIDGVVDFQYLLKFFKEQDNKNGPFFDMYCQDKIPLALLATIEGGLTRAIARIQRERKGYIHFCSGSMNDFENQILVAKGVLDEKKPFYIDGTSALFLSELGYLKSISSFLPNMMVPQSVISLLTDIISKFTNTSGMAGFLGHAGGKISFDSFDEKGWARIKTNFSECLRLLNCDRKKIRPISFTSKGKALFSKQIPAELSDACIFAQEEKTPILTEDYLYLYLNEHETGKNAPEHFSSLALMRALWEKGLIPYDSYLNYFYFLSSYRFSFLHLSIEFMRNSLFGDGEIKIVRPENIRKLNFQLTLSEDYGVLYKISRLLVGGFLLGIITDFSVVDEILEKIFVEIIETFPYKGNKKGLCDDLLNLCFATFNQVNSEIGIPVGMVYRRFERLIRISVFFSQRGELWTPHEKS